MDEAKTVICMADDDEDDRYFLRRLLQEVYPSVRVVEAQDGRELLNLLYTWSQQAVPQPIHLILLDMNMPRLNGLETLRAIETNTLLRHVPTVFLSTSAKPAQQDMAYRCGANGYLEKPASYAHLNQLVRSISGYLVGTATV